MSQAVRRARSRSALLESAARGLSRYGYGHLRLEQVARMHQEPGLAWLERQAEVAEDLVAERQATARRAD